MQNLADVARKVSNWGRWGADDEIGTLNYVTPEVVRRGVGAAKRGVVFSLGLGFDAAGPQIGTGGRVNPIHLMSAIDGGLGPDQAFRYADDWVTMPLQCATQWDSLAHVHYGGQLYNGHPVSSISAAGASRNSIDKIGRGVISRGVLFDVARLRGVDRVAPGVVITPDDLDAAERAAGVTVGPGDVLLLRTGHLSTFKKDGDRLAYMKQEPGLGLASVEWLHEKQVAAVAADTQAIEVLPCEDPKVLLPFHMVAIRDMGLTLGEMFDLDELAEDCARDGVFECLFCAPPLKITGGVGSPLNPLAVK